MLQTIDLVAVSIRFQCRLYRRDDGGPGAEHGHHLHCYHRLVKTLDEKLLEMWVIPAAQAGGWGSQPPKNLAEQGILPSRKTVRD